MADEQVGNNSWVTMTPGSAVAGQLQNILTQKRLEARQAMLDQIHSQDVASQIRDRDENTRSNAEIRQGNAENRIAQAGQRFMAGLGDNPAQVDSATAEKIRKIAPTRIQTIPSQTTLPSTPTAGGVGLPGTGVVPVMKSAPSDPVISPEVNNYLGSSAYQKQHEAQIQLKAAFDDPNFMNLSPEQQLLKISEIYPGQDPAPMLEKILTAKSQQAPGRLHVWSDTLHKTIDGGPIGPNDKSIVETREPRLPVDHGTFLDRPVMINGKEDPTKVYAMVNGKLTIQPVPDGASLGAKRSPVAKPIQVPQGLIKQLGDLKAAMVTKPGMLWDTPPSDQVIAAYHQKQSLAAMNMAKDQAPAFQNLLQHILGELQDPKTKKSLTTDDIINHYQNDGVELSPNEKDNLSTILQAIR